MDAHRSSSSSESSWWSNTNMLTRILGFSMFASVLDGGMGGGGFVNGRGENVGNGGGAANAFMTSLRLFLIGTMIETGRRLFQWVIERFKFFQYSVTAQFEEDDPAYQWIVLLLTEERIWRRSRQFHVSATSSFRKWAVSMDKSSLSNTDPHGKPAEDPDAHAEYVPTYNEPQLFRWRGYWAEIKKTLGPRTPFQAHQGGGLHLTMYTRDISALSALVEDAHERYVKTTRPHVIVHTANKEGYHGTAWSSAKSKQRRPLSSIILQEGVIQSLVADAREFIATEEWYTTAGIPYRRGYLLYGPPGTGKTSTIYAVAGELGLEIYSLSLASGFIDDSFLQHAVSGIPKQAILLIEDIDCAFPSREELDPDSHPSNSRALGLMDDDFGMDMLGMVVGGKRPTKSRSRVTLSGLLNVLDGVGSEEGKIFFATTNYIDRLDPAFLRPGRIDKKIQYKLATNQQAAALFRRFYPEKHTKLLSEMVIHTAADASNFREKIRSVTLTLNEKESLLTKLSEQFASYVPDHEFSTAELQGFLLTCKQEPEKAVAGVAAWVEQVREEREARMRREEERRLKKKRGMETKTQSKEDIGVPSVGYPLPGSVAGGGGFVGGGGTNDAAMVVPVPPPNTLGAVGSMIGLGLAGTSSSGGNITFLQVGEPPNFLRAPAARSSVITTTLDLVDRLPITTTPPAPDSPAGDLVRRRSSWAS
ncbi:hypothetical protein M413DRAFT_27547 [Hebeloma cylindrosporum]|uniref:AAA+ ATPase domain-containing protein n=1 Tax=Hebeloma cylindrosporum TaxID=76867 RepID=A0A0C3CCQ1_HEBCY|nr:hypothetical protein M413DRAFT_27547 [Hebeloma cylindrosporum h7]